MAPMTTDQASQISTRLAETRAFLASRRDRQQEADANTVGFLNRLELAEIVVDAHLEEPLPLDGAIDTLDWPEDAVDGLYDIKPNTVYDAEGEEIGELGYDDGAIAAGHLSVDPNADWTDWDEFRVETGPNAGRLSIAKILDWAAQQVGGPTSEVPSPSAGEAPAAARDLSQDPELAQAVQAAQDAAYGDSNDAEIALLREALELALSRLGHDLPEGRDPADRP